MMIVRAVLLLVCIVSLEAACIEGDPFCTTPSATGGPPKCRNQTCADVDGVGCELIDCAVGYECCVGPCNDARCQKIYGDCPPSTVVYTCKPVPEGTILPVCDDVECRLDQECCYDPCGSPRCVDRDDPVGAGIYPTCPRHTAVTRRPSATKCKPTVLPKTCDSANCTLLQSCCVDSCTGVKCIDKFGYCPNYDERILCIWFNPKDRCDVKSCPEGTKCCVGICKGATCIDASIPTSPCLPSICRKKCGDNAFCQNYPPCDKPKCLCYDPNNGPTDDCMNQGPGCEGHVCSDNEVCCLKRCNFPACVSRTNNTTPGPNTT